MRDDWFLAVLCTNVFSRINRGVIGGSSAAAVVD
jgi:hypothetical protein